MRAIVLYALLIPLNVFAFQNKQTIQKYKDSIAVELMEIISDSLRAGKYYNEANYAMRRLNDLKLGRTYIDSAFYYSKKSNHKDLEAKCHFMYGVLERVEGNYQKALEHLDTNIRYFKNDSTLMSYALFQVGVIHNETGNYEKSLKTYFDILKIFETKKDSFAIASTLNSIAVINGQMDRNDEAIDNFKRAVIIFEALDKQRDMSNTLKNIGEMYLIKNDVKQARTYLERSLEIAKEIDQVHAKSMALHILGKTYLDDEPQTAFRYLSEAEAELQGTNFNNVKISVFRDLGAYYTSQNNDDTAIRYYQKALEIAEMTNDVPSLRDLNKSLSDVYFKQSDYGKAYNYQKAYIVYKDSILSEEKIKAVNQLQIQFETEKKEKEIIAQELQLNKQEEAYQKKQVQYNYMTGIAIFLLLTSILIFFGFKQRQKRKTQEILTLKREHQIKTLEALIEGEENERFRIAKELHDGVNGDLSAIKYKLSSLMEMNNKVIKEAIAMIDDSCKQVRAISHDLVPPSLENFNLVEATEVYCNNLNETHSSTEIVFQYLGDAIAVSKKVEINMFRIIQELVTNSLKHAEATVVNVQISNRNAHIQITVEDNGIGFNKDEVTSKGIGLGNVQSRVEYLNASIDLISNENGTSYTIDIDIDQLHDN
ncbi:tetratricopeptide repeat protein [Winogradskyella sp.]|uniref:tetratricopeptide repeat-containing sensor histidine kinase n=1 Tax=Winogradskyella sp. TaxID=1883156 RepID=UPI0035168BED